MKKEIAVIMALVMMFSLCLSGCNNGAETGVPDDGKNGVISSNETADPDDEGEKDPEQGEIVEENEPQNNETDKPNKDPEKKPDNSNETKPEEDEPEIQQPPVVDRMNWPSNEYTALVPKPSAGVVKKTDIQNGIFCLLLTGADMVDAKAYAGSLINYGFTNDVTETIEDGLYLFGGGNSKGTFVVVSYQSGQFIIGIEP